jgi:hypothetical protein
MCKWLAMILGPLLMLFTRLCLLLLLLLPLRLLLLLRLRPDWKAWYALSELQRSAEGAPAIPKRCRLAATCNRLEQQTSEQQWNFAMMTKLKQLML